MSQPHISLPFDTNGGVPLPAPQSTLSSASSSSTHPAPQAQNMAFQQNAQLPGVDMGALLQGISPQQLAIIGQLFKTGQLQLPPEPPPVPASVPGTSASKTSDKTHEQVPPKARGDAMDVDKEEGEWDEDEDSGQTQREFLRPPPRGPKLRSSSPRDRRRRSNEGVSARNSKTSVSTPLSSTAQRKAKRESAKAFVLALHRAGFTFADLAREIGDSRMLGLIYHELDLEPSSHQRVTTGTPHANGKATTATDRPASIALKGATVINGTSSRANVASANTEASSSNKQLPAVKPAAAVDRSAYLAKLKAAKNKTVAAPATALGTATSPSNAYVNSTLAHLPKADAPASGSPAEETVGSAKPTQQPRKAKLQTELVRQRLAALREEQARRDEVERPTGPADTKPNPVGQGTFAHYDAVAQVVQATAPGLSAQQVNDAVTVIANALPAQNALTQPDRLPHAAPPLDPIQIRQLSHTNVSSQASVPGTPFLGLPGLFSSGSPFEARRAVQLPGLTPSSVTAPRVLEHKSDPPALASAPFPGRSRESNPSPTSSEASSRVNCVLASPITAGEEIESSSAGLATQKRAAVESKDPPPKRRFGQAVLDHVIIDNSDDEQEIDDDPESELGQIDESGNATPAQPESINTTNGVNHPGALRNFPPSGLPGLSYSSMPPMSGATTPGGTPYERKLLEIQEMNRRIQELRERKLRASGRTTPTSRDAAAVGSGELLTAADDTDSSTAVPSALMSSDLASPVAQSMPNQAEADVQGGHDKNAFANIDLQTKDPAIRTTASPEHASAAVESLDDAMDMSTEEDSESESEVLQQQDLHTQQPTQATIDSSEASSDDSDDSDHESAVALSTADREGVVATSNEIAQPIIVAAEPDGLGDDSSAASSTESEDDYEPEPAQVDETAPQSALHTAQFVPLPPQSTALPGLGSLSRVPTSVSMQDAQLEVGPQDVDLAPELQPDMADNGVKDVEATTRFTPYQSPLMMFKGYRYHPEYTTTVPGGFTSLTYNHRIDPGASFCPNEASDTGCQDSRCDYQHFRDVCVTDSDLLRELGTNNIPASTPEANQQWREGLGNVVKQLRATNLGKDVNAIAARIAQFRREFIGADKVLNLGVS